MTNTEITALTGAIVLGFLQAYSVWKQSQNSKKMDLVGDKLEVVRAQGNHLLGDQLQIGAVSARTLANQTNKHEHITLADIAENKYRQHVADQTTVNSKNI